MTRPRKTPAGKTPVPPPRAGTGAQSQPRPAHSSEAIGRFLGTLARLEGATAGKPQGTAR